MSLGVEVGMNLKGVAKRILKKDRWLGPEKRSVDVS